MSCFTCHLFLFSSISYLLGKFYSSIFKSDKFVQRRVIWSCYIFTQHDTQTNIQTLRLWTAQEQTWKKTIFFTPARFEQKLFYPRKCVTCDRSEFATKQHKMWLTTSMSKIRLPHIYRSNNYVIINKKSSFDSNI